MTALTNVASILAESAQRYPGKTALVLGETRLPYAAVWDQARRYAAVLRDRGIGPGRPGGPAAAERPPFRRSPTTAHSPLGRQRRARPRPAASPTRSPSSCGTPTRRSWSTAAPLLGEAAKGAELAGVDLVLRARRGRCRGGSHRRARPVGRPARPHGHARGRRTRRSSSTRRAPPASPRARVLTHDNILWNVNTIAFDTVRIEHDDVILGVLPLFHSFGQTVVMNGGFRVGATIALMPRFDGPRRPRPAGLGAGHVLRRRPDDVRRPARGGPQPPTPTSACGWPSAAARHCRSRSSTGSRRPSASTSTRATACPRPRRSPRSTRPGTAASPGRSAGPSGASTSRSPRPRWRARSRCCPTARSGRSCIRGHNIFSGYLNQPEATAAVMVDGWFRSGDLGYADDDGFIFIVDRKKDLIIRGGFNVYPREVEEVLATYPGVVQVAVVGVPDDTYGEEISAVVVAAPGADDRAGRADRLVAGAARPAQVPAPGRGRRVAPARPERQDPQAGDPPRADRRLTGCPDRRAPWIE